MMHLRIETTDSDGVVSNIIAGSEFYQNDKQNSIFENCQYSSSRFTILDCKSPYLMDARTKKGKDFEKFLYHDVACQ